MDIRIDCYYAVLDKYQKKYPNAHFELIMRKEFKHILSPSWDTIDKLKDGTYDFDQYKWAFINELYGSGDHRAIKKMQDLKKIAREKIVFLVCFEKDSTKCHRSFVKWIMEGGLSKYLRDDLPPLKITEEEWREIKYERPKKKLKGIDRFLKK